MTLIKYILISLIGKNLIEQNYLQVNAKNAKITKNKQDYQLNNLRIFGKNVLDIELKIKYLMRIHQKTGRTHHLLRMDQKIRLNILRHLWEPD